MGVGGDLVIVGVIKFEGNGRNHIGKERTSRSLSHADGSAAFNDRWDRQQTPGFSPNA